MATTTPPGPVRTEIDQIETRARRDFLWACAHLLKIRPKEAPLCALKLNWPQRYIAENYLIPAHARGLPLALSILKARREGVSTLILAWLYHKIRWYRGRNCMVYANEDDTLQELFGMIPRFHENLPAELQLVTDKNNTEELSYAALDSRVGRHVAGDRDIGRGKGIHHVLLSECDFYRNPLAVLPGIIEAVPTVGPSSLVLETTANGDGGYFHEHWKALKRQKGKMFGGRYWYPIFLPWFFHPDHRAVPPTDWEPTEEEYELLIRYKLSRDQLYWYSLKGAEMEVMHPGRGYRLRQQEYPSCIAGTMRVGTERGLLPLAEISSVKETTQGAVTGWYAKGMALTWEVRTHLGYTLEATEDHRVQLATGGWRCVRQLESGMRVQLSRPRFADAYATVRWHPFPAVETSIVVDEQWGRFLGLFTGDGSFNGQTLSLVCDKHDEDLITEVLCLIDVLFGLQGEGRVVGNQKGGVEIRAWCRGLQEVFRALGVVEQLGGRAWRRVVRIPPAIWTSPRSVIRAFLQGLYDTDGFAAYATPRISVFSRYQSLMHDVQLLLLGFGITGKQTAAKRSLNGKYYRGWSLDLRAEESVAFRERIGFGCERKRQRSLTWPDTQKTHARLPLTLTDIVTTVIPKRFTEVYDLTLATSTHAFDANGFVVHNCDDEAFLLSGQCIFPEVGLAMLRAHQGPPRLGFELVRTGDRRVDLSPKAHALEAPLQVWEAPHPDYEYALGVDVARGGGGDDSCVEVLRMPGFRQVAEWYDNYTSPRHLAFVVAAIARYYAHPQGKYQPIVNVELNGDGLYVNDELTDAIANGAPFGLYVWEPFDRVAPPPVTGASRTGWVTSHTSKNMLVSVANSLLAEGLVYVPSASLQAEMGRTREIRLGIAETRGADQVMAWLFALVTCYRKIARWSWPGQALPKANEEDDRAQRLLDPMRQDSTYGRIVKPRQWEDVWEDMASVPGGGWLTE